MNPIIAWLETLLETVLKSTSLPGWIVAFIINFVKQHITDDIINALEDHVKCYVCTKVSTLIGPTPSETEKATLAMLENLLSCSKCPKTAAP